MNKCRAKFKVQSHTISQYPGVTIKLSPEYDSSIPEDVRFCEATPSGSFEMFVNNPAAIEFFKIGKTFYIDMIECVEPAKV